MSRLKLIISIVIISTLSTLAIAEPIPKTLSYQGYLKNADGTPAAGPKNITFALYSSKTVAGTTLWSETHTDVPLTNGVYSVQLGKIVPFGGTPDRQAYLGVQVGWSYPSEIRLKQDITDVSQGLDFIKRLRPVEFRMKTGNGRKDFGFIAQDIEALMGTEYNVVGIGGDAERTLTLRYTDFIAPMVKAVQEQQTTIESQHRTIEEQKERISGLEEILRAQDQRLARLETLLSGKQ